MNNTHDPTCNRSSRSIRFKSKLGIAAFAMGLCLIILSPFGKAQNFFYHLLGNAFSGYVWTGGTGDGDWNNPNNWTTLAVPTATDVAQFKGAACVGANCDVTTGTSITIAGLSTDSAYAGTITQSAGQAMTIGSSGWSQGGGTFTGSDANVTINGIFTLTAGTYTATSAQTLVTSGFVVSAGTFNHSNGLLRFDNNGVFPAGTINVTLPGAVDLYDLQYSGGYGGSPSGYTINMTAGSFNVLNQFRIGRTVAGALGTIQATGGTINLKGNLIVDPFSGTAPFLTPTNLILDGAGAQTYDAMGGLVPLLTINKSSGTVTPTGGTTNLTAQGFNLAQGDFTAPPGIFRITRGFTIASGTVYTHNGSSLDFSSVNGSGTQTFNISLATALQAANLSFGGGNSGSTSSTTWALAGATPTINASGSLTVANTNSGTGAVSVSGGNVNVVGNITAGAYAGGNATITVNGAAGQTYTKSGAGGTFGGTIIVNKATGTASLATAASFATAGQDLTVTAGVMDMAGFALNIADVLTVSLGGKLLCNGGTLTALTYAIEGEVACGPSAGISWTGAAGDGLWSTAGNWTNGVVPGATDVALFNGQCVGANCDAHIDADISVRGIKMIASYTGTLTQDTTRTITLGAAGWNQAGGTFAGGDAAITLDGPFSLSAGTYTATSGITTVNGTVAYTVSGTPVYNHNSGTLAFSSVTTATTSITPGTVAYNKVQFNGYNMTSTVTGSMTVEGELSLADTYMFGGGCINLGTILAKGDVINSSYGKTGSTLVKVNGSGNQTVTGVTGASIPNMEIDSSGGTVTLTGALIFTAASFTYTAGTVDTSASELVFSSTTTASTSFTPGAIEYENVSFQGLNLTTTITGTATVKGVLKIGDTSATVGSINGGTIIAKGDVTTENYGKLGTTLIQIGGSTNQTITGVATAYIPPFEVASTGGTVTYAGSLVFRGNYTYTSGVVDPGTSTVTFSAGAVSVGINSGAQSFNNVTFAGTSSSTHYVVTGNMTVNGLLTLNCTGTYCYLDTGTILAYNGVTTAGYGLVGSGLVKVVGTANQTITGAATAVLPNVEIASTGGTVSLAGSVIVSRNYTHTSGTVSAGTSTLQFGYSSYYGTTSSVFTPGTVAYNAVTFAGTTITMGLAGGTLTANGTVTFADSSSTVGSVNSGTIDAGGDIVFSSYGKLGSAVLNSVGTTTSLMTIATTSSKVTPTITVAKTGGGKLTLASNSVFTFAGQDLTVASGTLDMAGFDLTIPDVLTVDTGATLSCSGGDLTYASIVNTGTVNCPGFATYDFNWTGAAADGNWNTAGNWAGGIVPSGTSVVVFNDAYCGANCNSTMNATVNVRGVDIKSGYTGTITQGAGIAVTVGNRRWKQANGSFAGSDAAITVSKSFSLTGGTFTSTSGTFTLYKNAAAEGGPTGDTVFTVNGGAFVPNGGTLKFNELNGSGSSYTHNINVPSGLTAANLILNADGAGAGTTTWNFNAGQTLRVTGAFTIGRISGTNNVAVSATSVELNGNANFNAGTNGGAVTTLLFKNSAANTITVAGSPVMPTGAVTFNGTGGSYALTGTLPVNGVLTIGNATSSSATINTGTITAQGNVVFNNFGYAGTALLNFTGTTATTLNIAGTAAVMGGTVTVAKTGAGSLTLQTATPFSGPSQAMTITSGTVNMAANNLDVAGLLTIAAAGTLNCSGGALTHGSITAIGQIDCPSMHRKIFLYTGANQTFTVPAGVTSVTAKAWGGGGGGVPGGSGYGGGFASSGGGGGFATGAIAVSAGQNLTVIVGGGGAATGGTDIYGGGARGTNYGGGGGGRSAVRDNGGVEILTAGAGGGGGSSASVTHIGNTNGGAGGGTTGATGASSTYPAIPGRGGTPSVGGAGGVGSTTAGSGSQYAGGRANADYAGAGGGGGYFGGGASDFIGSTVVAGAGGGSSYISGAGVTSASTTAGAGATPGNSADADNGGYGTGGVAAAGTAGKVLLTW